MSTPIEPVVTPPATEPVVPPAVEPPVPVAPSTLEEALALLEAEKQNSSKWQAMSRKNEKNFETVSKERDDLKASQMTDAEKALEAARTEGRTSALSEVGMDLVNAEMAIQAATAGVKLPDTQYLNMTGFLGEDGRPNKDAVKTFVESLPKAQTTEFTPLQGAGKQTGGAPSMDSMDPSVLADFIADGSYL
ncbi:MULTISPECIES: hypothetical protein [unclassified Streptomyces]|uniref:hypothetical protein n=1 Tax=unclassified Streptomyces TaxID=2593676 RepID=UPI0007C674BF|nr:MULTISPECIES: hypothetical protein [unclassified Streptomyces]